MKRDRGAGEVSNAGGKVGAGVKPAGVFARIAQAAKQAGLKRIVRHTQAENLKK